MFTCMSQFSSSDKKKRKIRVTCYMLEIDLYNRPILKRTFRLYIPLSLYIFLSEHCVFDEKFGQTFF